MNKRITTGIKLQPSLVVLLISHPVVKAILHGHKEMYVLVKLIVITITPTLLEPVAVLMGKLMLPQQVVHRFTYKD
jgi:hypothetical protein